MQSRLLPERFQQMNYSLLHFCKKKKKLDSLMWKLHILGDMLMHEWLEPPGRGAATDRHAGAGVIGTCGDCLSLSVEELSKSSHFRDF